MERVIRIDGKDVRFRATAAIPRMYRIRFGRDIMRDMMEIKDAIDKGDQLPIKMLTCFEQMAYLMAKHAAAGGPFPDTVDDWLDGFDAFSIYEIFPEIADLWGDNVKTLETPKKK